MLSFLVLRLGRIGPLIYSAQIRAFRTVWNKHVSEFFVSCLTEGSS
jgi:hypothetical protein